MRIFKIKNDDYNVVKHIIDGVAFHRPVGDTHHEVKFIKKKVENDVIDILGQNNVVMEDTGKVE